MCSHPEATPYSPIILMSTRFFLHTSMEFMIVIYFFTDVGDGGTGLYIMAKW